MKPDLNAIRERAEKATPGPWDIAGCNGELTGINGPSGFDYDRYEPIPAKGRQKIWEWDSMPGGEG